MVRSRVFVFESVMSACHTPIWQAFAALVLTVAPLVAAEPADEKDAIVLPLDMEMVRRNGNFGFSDAEIAKYFSAPLRIDLDRSGMDRSLLSPPPPHGVHPRVLFNPEDLPEIRRRLESTACGRLVMGNIRKHVEKQLRDPKSGLAAQYDDLAAGRDETPAGVDAGRRDVAYVVLYECFRCLVDDDAVGGKKAAAAVTTLARITERNLGVEIDKARSKNPRDVNDFRVVAQGPTFEGTLGLMYDFTHGFMTDQQRADVRRAVAKGSAGMTFIGCETLRSLTTNTSNWIPWSARMLFLCCSLEGEEGYDPAAYDRCVEAVTANAATIFPDGEAYEGWGKNFMFLEHLAIVAKRGRDVIASRGLRNTFRTFYIAAVDPWGGRFTFYDSSNGTGSRIARNADVVLYNLVFPDDAAGRFVYRNQVLEGYEALTEKDRINTRHPFSVTDPLVCAIYANDVDTSSSWDESLAEVARGRPLTQFSPDTCNLITRSAWTPDAVYVTYQNRALPGGHLYADRSHFNLYAHGRYWGLYRTLRQAKEHYKAGNRSVVMIDGKGASTAPARCVACEDRPQATFIATDLRVTWDYSSNYVEPAKDRSKTVSMPSSRNHFRLQPSPVPWMDMPTEQLPDWLTSRKPEPLGRNPSPFSGWTKREPGIRRAFRTCGMVRGPHPYVLVLDDIELDGRLHEYSWNLTVADDVTLGATKVVGGADWPMAQLVLDETTSPQAGAERHLLIRFLEGRGLDAAAPPSVEPVTLPDGPQGKPFTFPKLVVRARSDSPNFKALLFPFREGDALPKTTWNDDHTVLSIVWPDQHDLIAFAKGEDGRTLPRITRDETALLDWHAQ